MEWQFIRRFGRCRSNVAYANVGWEHAIHYKHEFVNVTIEVKALEARIVCGRRWMWQSLPGDPTGVDFAFSCTFGIVSIGIMTFLRYNTNIVLLMSFFSSPLCCLLRKTINQSDHGLTVDALICPTAALNLNSFDIDIAIHLGQGLCDHSLHGPHLRGSQTRDALSPPSFPSSHMRLVLTLAVYRW